LSLDVDALENQPFALSAFLDIEGTTEIATVHGVLVNRN
jgi:hypothetical protein